MNRSTRNALFVSLLTLAPALEASNATGGPHYRIPNGIYAVVPVEGLVSDLAGKQPLIYLNAELITAYSGLLDNPAVSGLTLQVHWDTLNPKAGAYSWAYVEDAFTAIHQWNDANPGAAPKTIQLIVDPGFDSPQWELDKLSSCDGLFDSSQPYPTSKCGKATFAGNVEAADSDQLPMPWNATYKADFRTFLTALNGKFGNDAAFVSIAVGGPTAASAEMLLPHGDNLDQQGGTQSSNSMWEKLLANAGKPAYTDDAFVTEWKHAIDMYGEVFSDLTLVLTTGDGLPNLTGAFTTPSGFLSADCTSKMNMDCAAEATVLSYFIQSGVGGVNAKATQTSGMEAQRVDLYLGLDGVKNITENTMTMPTPSTLILGGAQFNTSFSVAPVSEGCTSKFPPAGYAKASDVPVSEIPPACLNPSLPPGALAAAGFKFFDQKKEAAYLISPEQAAANVLQVYFTGTPAAADFGGTADTAPLNYLQIYYQDIQYAWTSTTAQSLLNLASTQLAGIEEVEP